MSTKNVLDTRRVVRRGFTLIELLVVMTIIAILGSLVIVAIGVVRFQARNTACASQLRQWGLVLIADAKDHKGMLCSDQLLSGGGANACDFALESYRRFSSDYGMPSRIQGCPHLFMTTTVADYDAWAQSYVGYNVIFLGYSYWVQRPDNAGPYPPTNVACPTRLGASNPGNVPMMSDYFGGEIGRGVQMGGHQRGGADSPRTGNELFTDGHVSAVTDPSAIVWRYNGNWENWR